MKKRVRIVGMNRGGQVVLAPIGEESAEGKGKAIYAHRLWVSGRYGLPDGSGYCFPPPGRRETWLVRLREIGPLTVAEPLEMVACYR